MVKKKKSFILSATVLLIQLLCASIRMGSTERHTQWVTFVAIFVHGFFGMFNRKVFEPENVACVFCMDKFTCRRSFAFFLMY